MLKHAVIAGLVSQGADAADMGFCGYSAFEHGIRASATGAACIYAWAMTPTQGR